MLSFMGGIGWISLKAGRHWYKVFILCSELLIFLLLTHRCAMIKEQINCEHRCFDVSFPGPQELKIKTKGIFKNLASRNNINWNLSYKQSKYRSCMGTISIPFWHLNLFLWGKRTSVKILGFFWNSNKLIYCN